VGQLPCFSHPRKLTNLCTAEAWGVNSPTGQTECVPHQLFHLNILSLPGCICCCSSCPSLHHRFGKNCPYWLDLLAFLYLFWAGCIISLLLLTWSSSRTLLFHTYYSCAGSDIRSCAHNHTTYVVCSHGNQHICFNPTYCPWEQWLEVRSIWNHGTLVSCTQVFSSDKPVSLFFDACAAIDQGGCGGIGYGCGGLARERAYMSNDKYICRKDNSWPCDNVSYYCPYWSCVSWATWERIKHAALLHKGRAASNCTPGTCNPVNFTLLKPSDWTQGMLLV
jgi:hypothetical protein